MVFVRAEKHRTWFARHFPATSNAINKMRDRIETRSFARGLCSSDPNQMEFAAWKIKCAADEGKDLSFLPGILKKMKFNIFQDANEKNPNIINALIRAVQNGNADTSPILPYAASAISCNGKQHIISLNAISVIGSAERKKDYAMELLVKLLTDTHASHEVLVHTIECIRGLTKKGADPSSSFGILIDMLQDKGDLRASPSVRNNAMMLFIEANLQGFDIIPAIRELFKEISRANNPSDPARFYITLEHKIRQTIESIAINATEDTRIAITVEINAILHSNWFMRQTNANSRSYEDLITYLADVMATLQKAENGLQHAAASQS